MTDVCFHVTMIKIKGKTNEFGLWIFGNGVSRQGRLPTATVAFPCPPVITGGPGTSLLGCFFVFFIFFFSQHWQPRGGAPLWCLSVWSLDRTRLLPQSETVAVGWSFYSKDNLLCVFHPAAVGSALLAPLREIMEMIVRRGLSSCPDTNPRVHVRYLITLGWFPPADFGAKMLVVNYIAKTKLIFIFGQGLLLSFFCQEVIMLPESGPGPGPGALWAGCLLVISILLAKVLWTSLSLSLWFSIFPFLRTCHRSSASPDDLCLDGLYLSIIPK